MNLKDVKVGDKLYDAGVRSDRRLIREPVELTVTKVARKYLYATGYSFDELKIDRDTGYTARDWDNFQVYLSKEHFEDRELCKSLSEKIANIFGPFGRTVPEGVTSPQLQNILDILEGKE